MVLWVGEVVGVWFHDEDGFVGCREGEGVVAQQPELQGTAGEASPSMAPRRWHGGPGRAALRGLAGLGWTILETPAIA